MGEATPIVPLLKTVFESISEVFILCVAGYILARRGILDRKTQKQLNRLNVSLFTPALLFSKVAFFLSPAKLRELWIIPIFFVITTVVSMAVAFVLGSIFRLKRSQRSFAVAAAMFMNSNSLPIALMQSLVLTVPGLKWEDDDDPNAMVGRALTYLVLYSTLGMVVRWSYGVRLLSQADPEGEEGGVENPLLDPEESAFPQFAEEIHVLHRDQSSAEVSDSGCPSITVHESDRPKQDPKFFYSFPNTPIRTIKGISTNASNSSVAVVPSDEEDEAAEDEILEFPGRRHMTGPSSSKMQSRIRQIRTRIRKMTHTLYEFMTVPLYAALASLVVACVQPLQHILEEHAQPIKRTLNSAGNVSIPLTLVVLGAYFYSPPDDAEAQKQKALPITSTDERPRGRSLSTSLSQLSLVDNVREMFKLRRRDKSPERRTRSNNARPGETATVVIAILSRMIITPMLLLPMMALAARYDLQDVFEDPVFVVSNVLLIASPPALTLAQITQAASGDAFERLISRTIFWSYCLVTPPTTILFVVIGLILSKL